MSPSEGRRVLVTGGSGFTGTYVMAALTRAGYEPVDAESSDPDFDLANRDSVRAVVAAVLPDFVIHLAALSFVGHDDAAAFYAVNAVGTTHLLDAVASLQSAPRRVVVASSANVYGNSTVEPITEATPAAPVNHYAASKMAMEAIARTYVDRLPLVITRPFNYTGVGQADNFLVPKLVAHFAEGRPSIELGNLDVVRDFSDVRGIAEAYVRLLTAEVAGGITNLCSGVGHPLSWILRQLSGLSGHELELKVNTTLVRTSEVHRLVGSNAIMWAALGDLPFSDFRETLKWMLDARAST